MKKIKSIGLIETLGMVGAVEAADAALKAANVTLLGYEFNGAGYVVIKLTGDVAAVQAAVSSGGATAERLGNLVATHVIARPDEQVIDREIKTPDNVPPFDPPPRTPSDPDPDPRAAKAPEKPAAAPAPKPEPAPKPAAAPAPKKEETPAAKKPASTPAPKPASKAPSKPAAKKPSKPAGKTAPKSSGKPKGKK